VQCNECITGRHLLERTAAAVHQSLQEDAVNGDVETYTGRCENISTLVSHLQSMLRSHDKFVLVFDGIDQQREAPPTLLPALARLGEFVRENIVALRTPERS
jgi:origin recognition complex subunit 5